MNKVGLDWDNIMLHEAQRRRQEIERKEGVSTILYQTTHGYHCVLLFNHPVSVEDNFKLRERYWDDKNRLKISKLRYKTIGCGWDLLFDCKNGHWRTQI